MRTIPREVFRCGIRDDPVETTRRRLINAKKSELKAYLLGALHDATFSRIHRTWRFSQSNVGWLKFLQFLLVRLGHKSWVYREGKTRFVWVLETTAKISQSQVRSKSEKIMYVRGYFDAEGGMPKKDTDFLYFQFCQKDIADLERVRSYLKELDIECGVIHNPSKRVDGDYWRFFVSRKSHGDFMRMIYSFHPRKMRQMDIRMKI
jgi:hypothetical protein